MGKESTTYVEDVSSAERRKWFWNSIWGKQKGYNVEADWIKDIKRENKKIPQQQQEDLTTVELRIALGKTCKWKPPDNDQLPLIFG